MNVLEGHLGLTRDKGEKLRLSNYARIFVLKKKKEQINADIFRFQPTPITSLIVDGKLSL